MPETWKPSILLLLYAYYITKKGKKKNKKNDKSVKSEKYKKMFKYLNVFEMLFPCYFIFFSAKGKN